MKIDQVAEMVKNKLQFETTGHDYLHALRVRKNALFIMEKTSANTEVVEVACLIHDLIDHKLDLKYTYSLPTLHKKLVGIGYDSEFIEEVLDIIQNISFSKNGKPRTIEGEIVQDADRLDALGAIGIARTFAFGGKNNKLIYGDPNKRDSVNHFYEKLLHLEHMMNTNSAKLIAKERTEYMRDFLDKFYEEI